MWEFVECLCPKPETSTKDAVTVVPIKLSTADIKLKTFKISDQKDQEPRDSEYDASEIPDMPYKPKPYTFRLGCGAPSPGQQVRTPPVWLLVDHTLAVIWCLFTPGKQSTLGIVQLQWALAFLKGLRNKDGQCSKDVQLCIDIIEERLISQYAEMKDVLERTQTNQACGKIECLACNTQAVNEEVASGSQAKGRFSKSGQSKKKHFKCPNSGKPLPMSVTYTSMMETTGNVKKSLSKGSTAETERKEISSNPEIPLDDIPSKNEVIELIKQWREEQYSRIEDEKKRLQKIESLMENINKM